MSDAPETSPEAAPPPKGGAPRWLFFAPLAVLAIIAGVSLAQLMGPKPEPASFTSPIRPVPKIEGTTLEGQKVDFGNLKGPVIVNVWATWCAPCKAEHPVLMKLKAEGAHIIGIQHTDDGDRANLKAATDKARAILEASGNPFEAMVVDPTGDLSLGFGVVQLPESFLIDPAGQIVTTIRDPILGTEGDEFIAAWRRLVAKSGAPNAEGRGASSSGR